MERMSYFKAIMHKIWFWLDSCACLGGGLQLPQSTYPAWLGKVSCTLPSPGCLLNSASTTSWPCWRSRLSRRHLRSIWTSTSRCAPVHATLDRRPSHCCACHFDGHHLPDRSFSTAAPLTWNSQPPAVLNCDSLSTFKSRLKTHLFSTAFCYLLILPTCSASASVAA